MAQACVRDLNKMGDAAAVMAHKRKRSPDPTFVCGFCCGPGLERCPPACPSHLEDAHLAAEHYTLCSLGSSLGPERLPVPHVDESGRPQIPAEMLQPGLRVFDTDPSLIVMKHLCIAVVP